MDSSGEPTSYTKGNLVPSAKITILFLNTRSILFPMKLALVMPLIAVVLTSACVSQNGAETGGPGQQEPGVAEFSVVIQHTAYQPNEFRVKMGDTVKFSLLAASGTERHKHGITIDEYNINQVVESSLN